LRDPVILVGLPPRFMIKGHIVEHMPLISLEVEEEPGTIFWVWFADQASELPKLYEFVVDLMKSVMNTLVLWAIKLLWWDF